MSRESLVLWFAVGVGGVWGIVTIVSLFGRDYTVLGIITPVMLIVSGFLFGHRTGNGKNS